MSENVQLLECSACGSTLDPSLIKNGICRCKYCSYNNIIPRNDTSNEVISLLVQGDGELRCAAFERAYNAYSRAAELSPEESRAYFGMALATNRIKYIKDVVNDVSQPVCFEASEKRVDSDNNYLKALNFAYNDDQYAEYERKAQEIDYIRAKFKYLKNSGLRYDTFICVKVSDGNGGFTQDSVWAGKLYDALKRNGSLPFFSERDIGDRVGEDYEALILYALSEAKSLIIVCSNEDYLRTPWVQNEYSRYYAMLDDNEKQSGSIMIAFNGQPVERVPGIRGKIQGVNLQSFDASQRICEFVKRFADTEKEQTKLCVICGAECTLEEKICKECNGTEFAADTEELIRKRAELDSALSEADRKRAAEEKKKAEEDAARRDAERRAEQLRAQRELEIEEALNSTYSKMNFVLKGTVLEKFIGSATEVNIPYGITEIGKDAFYSKKQLTDIELPETLIAIGKNAFWGCKGIKKITVPSSVCSVGANAFFDCTSLAEVHISDINAWCKIKFDNNSSNPIYYAKALYLNGKPLARLVIPEGISEISPFAFTNCRTLVSVTVPDTVTAIGKDAFYGCEKLVDIVNRSSVKVAASSLSGGALAFYSAAVSTSRSAICETDGFLFFTKKGNVYLVGYEGDMADVRLPQSFEGLSYSVHKYAFYKNTGISTVTVPESVTEVEKYAFAECGPIKLHICAKPEKNGLPQGFHKKCIDDDAQII